MTAKVLYMKKPEQKRRGKSPKASPLVLAAAKLIDAEMKRYVTAAHERAEAGAADEAQGLIHYVEGLSRGLELLGAAAHALASKPMA